MFPGDAQTSRPAPSSSARWALVALAVGLVGAPGSLATPAAPARQTSGTPLASPSPPAVVAEIQAAVEGARQRFEARDAGGVLACISDKYRSGGLTKAAVREQLLAIFAVYQELRARVTVDQVQTVDGSTWLYTTGDISGRVPFMGRVTVLKWERQPEVARLEGSSWRLYGFQD
jgi:hypothetical protein